MIDLLASEYGWTKDEILMMPIDQTPQLVHAILHRKGVRCYFKNQEKDESAPSLYERIQKLKGEIDTTE